MSIDTLGLREQKKRETRQAISDHATQLFLERGFDRTTIADIAAAARVAKMTVTNYFPRKEDLALDHHETFVAGLAEAVARRAAGESALGAVRRAYMEALARHDPVIGFTGPDFARMIADSPTLVARLRDLHDQREEALAHHLATEPPTPPTAALSRVREVGSGKATGMGSGETTGVGSGTAKGGGAADGGRPNGGATGVGMSSGEAAAYGGGSPSGRHLAAEGAEGGEGSVVVRAVAAQLGAADRLLFRELQARVLAGEPEDEIAAALAEAARQVFDLLEPAIGGYAVR